MSEQRSAGSFLANAVVSVIITGATVFLLHNNKIIPIETKSVSQSNIVFGEVQPKVILKGPTEAKIGDPVILDASESSGDTFYWDSENNGLLVIDKKRAILPTSKEGVFTIRFTSAGTVKENEIHIGVREVASHTVRVSAHSPHPSPTPDPFEPPLPPTPKPLPIPPVPTEEAELAGYNYANSLKKIYQDGFYGISKDISEGKEVGEAQLKFQEFVKQKRIDSYNKTIGKIINPIIPENEEPKTKEQRDKFAEAWKKISDGVNYGVSKK